MKRLLCIIFLLSASFIYSQINDSLFIKDTITTTIPDSLLQPKANRYNVDTTIFAVAKDSIFFLLNEKKMMIFGEGDLKYKQTQIKSANIQIDFENSDIDAIGIPSDSVDGKFIGTPVLTEGAETYDGFRMRYNFKTGRGLISTAQTEQEGSKYTGEKIKKVDRDVYFIEDGIYTTCEEDSCPHYHFYSPRMKVIQKEQLVAEWIWLHFGGVPFPIPLPFAVFPIESGRRSGIIPPAFGEDPSYGTYFSRFGYFWAINDYMDLNLTADYYTRGSYRLDSRYRYVKRYTYNGNLEGSYAKFVAGEQTDADRQENIEWRLRWNHNQTITPTMRFDARLEFLSGNRIQRNIQEFNEILRNEAISNATLFKSWEESGNSISLSYNRRQVFETNEINEILPSLTFTKSQSYPFKGKGGGSQAWYETFGYSYSGKFQNNRNKVGGDLKIRGGIQHQIRTSVAPKIGYFSFTPSFNYQERWYNKRIDRFSVRSFTGQDSVITNDVKEINLIRTFSFDLSATTKFYGMFSPNVLGISAIRHTVIPNLTYSYVPDFSKDSWGYYKTYKNIDGEDERYNPYEREIFGGPSSNETQALNFSVSNNFEMKTATDPTDTTSKPAKLQLLYLTGGLGYNFAADSLKLSDLRINYRTQIANLFSLNGSSSFTPYDYTDNVNKINKFLVNEGKGLLRLTSFNLSLSLTLSGDRVKGSDEPTEEELLRREQLLLTQPEGTFYKGLYNEDDPDFTIPWDISLNYNYSESRPIPSRITKNANISGSLNFNLTPSWKFSLTGSYDLNRKEFAAPQVRISRDLHCWIMNFTWNPIGTYRGYRFEIRVKAPQLQDLKVTKRDQFFEGR